jgi:hypothetical protein
MNDFLDPYVKKMENMTFHGDCYVRRCNKDPHQKWLRVVVENMTMVFEAPGWLVYFPDDALCDDNGLKADSDSTKDKEGK